MMKRIVSANKGLLAVLALSGYLAFYPLLWKRGIDFIYVYTFDRGCITRTRVVPELRSRWVAHGPLRGPVTALYWPVNALLLSRAKWN